MLSARRLSQAVAAVHAGTLTHRAAAKFAGVSLGKLQRAAFPERYAKGGAYAERMRAYNEVYRATNKERKRVYDAAYYAANKERKRAYYAANKERKRVYDAAYYAANKDKIAKRRRVYDAAYYAANKDKIAERRRAYYKGKIAKRRTRGHGA
jgi:hypothetical protein